MEDEKAKVFSPETKALIEKATFEGAWLHLTEEAKERKELKEKLAKTKDIKPLVDALTLVSKCRKSKGGGVCDPCWSEVTKALKDLGVHIWGY